MVFTIGTDIELFAVDNKGIHRSLCGKVGGTKEEPMQLEGYPNMFCVQEDNVSLEFNIPPASTKGQFICNVELMVEQSAKIMAKHNLSISTESSASFLKEELLHPNALVFGCEPDYNAWKMIENEKPYSTDESLRTCGGHIHVGTQDVDMISGIKNMDLFLGIPSIILDNTPSSIKRRELYGKAGAMRPKPYGFEYRTLSNFWVFDPKLIGWVYEQTKEAIKSNFKINTSLSNRIQKAINTGDINVAEDIIKTFGLTLPNK